MGKWAELYVQIVKMPKNARFYPKNTQKSLFLYTQISFLYTHFWSNPVSKSGQKVGKWSKKWAKLYVQNQKPLKKVTKIHPKTHKKWAWSNLGQQKWAEKWAKMGRNVVRNKPHHT